MNNTITSTGIFTERIKGAHYFIGIAVAIVFLISIVIVASILCKHASTTPGFSRQRPMVSLADQSIVVDIGLDENTIQDYPALVYSLAKLENNISSCCSICLLDYKNSDILRQLPECGHLFHTKCVDTWLRLHPTCPVCLNSPSATPLAEVVPLSHPHV